MQWFKLRPTFEIELGSRREDAIQALAQSYRGEPRSDLFFMHGEYGELHLPKAEHRLWSPHLSFYITEPEPDHTLVFGRFAPRVDVWTCVWIFYLVMAFSSFYGFTLAYSQWMLGHTAWGIWLGILPILAIAALYVVAHVGQQWSVDQMHALRSQLDELLERSGIATVAPVAAEGSSAVEPLPIGGTPAT